MKFKGITLTKRTDDRYQTKIQIGNITKYVYGNTKIECYNNYINHIKSTDTFDTQKTKLKDWIDIWFITYKSNNKTSSNESIKSILKNHIIKFYNRYIDEIKPIEILKQINQMQANHLRQAQKLFTVYNDIFDKALKNGLIKINPVATLKKPVYKAEEKNRSLFRPGIFIV